jgi:putative Holliday junction resolvase
MIKLSRGVYMRYMGLDLGTKTLGISLSNGIIASVYGTLRHNEKYDRIANDVKELAIEKKIDVIVLGFPKNMNNTIGERAEITLKFKEKLEELTKLPIELEDERLTSKVANDVLISADTSRKKRKERVDGMASVIILQSYLDRKVK